MTPSQLEAPPDSIVGEDGKFRLGRYSAPSPRINMLDVARPYHYPVPRFIKSMRLKEWQALQFGDERWFFFTALYSAKPVNLAIFVAYDRAAKRQYGFRRMFLGRPFVFPASLAKTRVSYVRRTSHFVIACSFDDGKVELDVAKAGGKPDSRFKGHFVLGCTPQAAAPLSVCLPLGMNRAMYSTKVLMPMSGSFRLGGEEHLFEGPSSMGILDDHKGFYPWRMRYDWVSGFGLDAKGRRVGFNLTDNQVKDQARYNENCVWINNKIWSLPPVKVTRPQGHRGEWIIQDTEGMVDLVFVPEAPNDIRFNLGLMATDYHGPFGSFRGIIKNGAGEKIDAERLFGAGEQKYVRG
jgi:hypothetical protein